MAGRHAERQGGELRARVRDLLLAGPSTGRRATGALVARLSAGAVFVAFGAAKFSDHASEVASFEDYGLPSPDAFVYAIGMVELAGGVLLVAGLGTRIASLVLVGDMIGAIILSGVAKGELISLTLAPVLLCATAFVLWTGPGRYALDRHLGGRAVESAGVDSR